MMRIIKFRLLAVLIVILSTLFLSSCSNDKKETAYCFSAVLEELDGVSTVSLYCSIPDESSSDGSDKKVTVLTLTGDSFETALKSYDSNEYEIYFNSMCAVLIGADVKAEHLLDVADTIFNDTTFSTSFSVYDPKSESDLSHDALHTLASDICNSGRIPKLLENSFTHAVSFFRNALINGGND